MDPQTPARKRPNRFLNTHLSYLDGLEDSSGHKTIKTPTLLCKVRLTDLIVKAICYTAWEMCFVPNIDVWLRSNCYRARERRERERGRNKNNTIKSFCAVLGVEDLLESKL